MSRTFGKKLVTLLVTTKMSKLVDNACLWWKKNWISFFFISLFSGIALDLGTDKSPSWKKVWSPSPIPGSQRIVLYSKCYRGVSVKLGSQSLRGAVPFNQEPDGGRAQCWGGGRREETILRRKKARPFPSGHATAALFTSQSCPSFYGSPLQKRVKKVKSASAPLVSTGCHASACVAPCVEFGREQEARF